MENNSDRVASRDDGDAQERQREKAQLTTEMATWNKDQGYGRGGTPFFTGVFETLARVALYPIDDDGLGTWFGAAYITFALRIDFVNVKHKENVRLHRNKRVTRASDPQPLK